MSKDLFSTQASPYSKFRPFMRSLQNYWKDGELKQIAFPLFIKVGRIRK